MKYNPCGRIVDFGRRAYVTKCRFWRDSDEEVEIVWYPAAPGAPVLGYPSKIQSLDLVSDPWLPNGVGEVYGAPRTFNPQGPIPFLKYDHVCGTADDFARGGLRDAPGPESVYTRDGIPVCCQPPFVGQGGAVGSGTADVVVTPGQLYCTSYSAEWVGLNTFALAVQAVDLYWQGNIGPTFVRLDSPLNTVGGVWELTNTVFPGPWITMEPWDGHGTRVFTNAAHPTVVFNVSCV